MSRDAFVAELGSIEDHIESMADLAREMLRDGVQALSDLDRDAAKAVASKAEQLAQMDEDIEAEILKFLTLQQPMAKDLRRMGVALKLITYINRVGRYGYDIAKVLNDWPEGRAHVARMVSIRDMAAKVDAMILPVIQAYREGTIPDESALVEIEDDVDAMRWTIFRECLTYMQEDPKNIEPCAHYMMVGRYLERCGDNVLKMAEKLHYAVKGQRIILH